MRFLHLTDQRGTGAQRRFPHPNRFDWLVAACLAAAFFLSQSGVSAAATVNVSNVDQLVAAVKGAGAGDTIVLAAGTYAPDGPLVVKSSLTIAGPQVEGAVGSPPGAVISGAAVESGSDDIFDVQAGATLTLQSVSLRLASSDGYPVDDAGTLVLQASELSQNNSSAAVLVEPGATLTATNSTFAGNLGDGLDVFGTANLVNATVADNKLGGIFDEPGSNVSITNTLVVRNGDGSKWSSDCAAPVAGSTTSFDGDGTCGANMHGDAKVATLNLNGGPTATVALQAGSPAIGAGSGCPSLDQRFAPRSGGCDIGSYQFGANVPARAASPSASTPPASAGGAAPVASGSAGAPSTAAPGKSGASGKPPTSSTAPAVRLAKLAAAGAIGGNGGVKLPFTLAGTSGRASGLVSFIDRRAHIRLHVTALSAVSVNAARGTATLSGAALNLATGRRVTFTITVTSAGRGTFKIKVGHYSRSGTLRSGRISIKA
jgi:hypothetical protein